MFRGGRAAACAQEMSGHQEGIEIVSVIFSNLS